MVRKHVMRVLMRLLVAIAAFGLAGALAADSATGASVGSPRASSARYSGSVTVLIVGSEWPNLDPPLDPQAAADQNYLGSIYGELFEQGPHNTIVPDLATGYRLSDDNKLLTISLRHGVRFQDGTPFTAQAVQANIQRDLLPANGCICDSDFSDVQSITTVGSDKVLLHLNRPDGSIVEAFIGDAPNWTVDPTALAKMGQNAYSQRPIGAGPFEVATNVANTKLVLKPYTGYWHAGQPHLASLTFLTIGNEESAYEALQAGSAQVAMGIGTAPLLDQAKGSFSVDIVHSPNSSGVELNTTKPPFNNIVAREAMYYATNAKQLLVKIADNFGVVTQTPSGPGGSYFKATIPGYRTHDLAKAKALVKQLGGLSFSLSTFNTPASQLEAEALQEQYQAAGMHVSLVFQTLETDIESYKTDQWQAHTAGAGGPDPDIGIQGLSTHLGSKGAFSGVRDPVLDAMITKSEETVNGAARAKIFDSIYKYISKKAYEPYLYAANAAVVTVRSLKGVRLTDATGETQLYWESARLTS